MNAPVVLFSAVVFTVTLGGALAAQEAIFSGPQAGEALPPLIVRNIIGPHAGAESDPIAAADGKPILLVFVHKRERPAFGLANLLTNFARTRETHRLQRQLVFLTDDQTETEKWIRSIPQHFEKGTPVGLSIDGAEGPGAYGLNRNVALTVLVGNQGKVTGNFALVQPGIAADGPKILKSIVEATGGGDVPDIAAFLPQGMRDRMRQTPRDANVKQDEKLQQLLRSVIQKDASDDDVVQAVKAVDDYVAGKPAATSELGRIAQRIVDSAKFADYGTPSAREALKTWAKKHSAPAKNASPARSESSPPSSPPSQP